MRNLLFFVFAFLSLTTFSQDVKEVESKMSQFASQTGKIIKFEDFNLDNLKLQYGGVATVKIRSVTSGDVKGNFLVISKKGQYSTYAGSIAQEDLEDTIEALKALKEEAIKDSSASSDYLENKFVTEDGLQLGYYTSSTGISWYIKLTKYGNDDTLFIKSLEALEELFDSALLKMKSI